jgi:hypothetical protein
MIWPEDLMRFVIMLVGLALFGVKATHATAQERPYYGAWRMNSAKSDFRGVTATYRDLGDGRIEVTGMGQKERFVIGRDGKDHPWVGGTTITWRDLDPTRYENVVKQAGKPLFTIVTTLSSDGKSQTSEMTTSAPGGGAPAKSSTTFARVSGGPSIFGTWRVAEAEGRLQIQGAGDAVTFRWVNIAEAKCRFDGKDCPLVGSIPASSSMTLRETGPRSFEYQDKTNGAVNYTSRFTVSDDGTTLTEDQTMATGEKWHIVYDREK